MWRLCIVLVVGLALLYGCEDENPCSPTHTLEGLWDLVGYADHGVWATTTGTALFLPDGSFAMQAVITFPDEPTDTLGISGTWSMHCSRVVLTTPDGSGEWEVRFVGDEATLSVVGSEPPTVIHLRRRE